MDDKLEESQVDIAAKRYTDSMYLRIELSLAEDERGRIRSRIETEFEKINNNLNDTTGVLQNLSDKNNDQDEKFENL